MRISHMPANAKNYWGLIVITCMFGNVCLQRAYWILHLHSVRHFIFLESSLSYSAVNYIFNINEGN